MKEKLEKYPTTTYNLGDDLSPKARHVYAVREKNTSFGRIVYLHEIKRIERLYKPSYYKGGIIICGYKIWPKGIWLFTGPKVKIIPKEERKSAKSQLVKKLKSLDRSMGEKIDYVEFWS